MHPFPIEVIGVDAMLSPHPTVAAKPDTWNWLENYSGRYDEGHDVAFALDGGVFACGTYAAGGPKEGSAWVARFTIGGTLQWFQTYEQPNLWDFAWGIAAAADGGAFVAGASQPGRDDNRIYEAWVMRLDSHGRVLWNRRLGNQTHRMHLLTSIVALEDGGAVALGLNYRAMPGGSAWLVRLRADGTVAWEREIRANSLPDILNVWTGSLRLGPTGLLYFAVNDGLRACWLHAFGLDGRLAWRQRFELSDYTYFYNTALDCDAQGITLAGWARATDLKTFSWVSRFDHAGSPLWTRTYNKGSKETHTVTAMACLEDQRTLLAGHSGSDYLGYKAWVEVLDRTGGVAAHRDLDFAYENALKRIRAAADGSFCGAGHCKPLVESLPRNWVHRSTVDAVLSAS